MAVCFDLAGLARRAARHSSKPRSSSQVLDLRRRHTQDRTVLAGTLNISPISFAVNVSYKSARYCGSGLIEGRPLLFFGITNNLTPLSCYMIKTRLKYIMICNDLQPMQRFSFVQTFCRPTTQVYHTFATNRSIRLKRCTASFFSVFLIAPMLGTLGHRGTLFAVANVPRVKAVIIGINLCFGTLGH